MGNHPRVTGLLLVTAWLLIVGLVLSGSLFLVIAFAFTVSPEASKLVLGLCLGTWVAVLVPLLMVVDRRTSMRRSTRRLLARAEAGDTDAMWRLVDGYLKGGQGLARDPSQANWWLQALAARGDGEAAFLLHQHVRSGIGTFRNPSGAQAWLSRAASLGHAGAAARVARQAADAAPPDSGDPGSE